MLWKVCEVPHKYQQELSSLLLSVAVVIGRGRPEISTQVCLTISDRIASDEMTW